MTYKLELGRQTAAWLHARQSTSHLTKIKFNVKKSLRLISLHGTKWRLEIDSELKNKTSLRRK